VPVKDRTAEGYPLGGWLNNQRTRKDRMSADRRQRLEALDGWVWDARDAAWEHGFEQLTAYVQAEGSARVPNLYRTAEGGRLGQWVNSQRSTKDTMSADRRERLEAVKGWVWDARSSKHARRKP